MQTLFHSELTFSSVNPVAWHVLLGLTLAFAAALRALKRHVLLLWFAALPGVAAHELAHWSAAILTNGKPTMPSVIPKKIGPGRYALGHVGVANARWYNAWIIALAPLLLAPAAFVLLAAAASGHSWVDLPKWLLASYLAATMLTECPPSLEDWKLSMRSFRVQLLLGVVGLAMLGRR